MYKEVLLQKYYDKKNVKEFYSVKLYNLLTNAIFPRQNIVCILYALYP